MQSAQQLAESIVQATAVTHNLVANPQQRAEAVQFFEQLKHGEIHTTVYAAAVLTGNEQPLEVQMSAYTLLQHLVRHRWEELSGQEQQQVTQLAYQHLQDVGHLGNQAAWALKSRAAMLLAAVIRQQGPTSYSALLPQLVAAAAESPLQAEMSCLVLQFVGEDITQYEERAGDWKRQWLAALLGSVEQVLPFLVELLQRHVQAGAAATQQGDAAAVRGHAAVVNAALGALSGFVEWAPLARLHSSQVVGACAFFLKAADFQAAALTVLKQIVSRKPSKELQEVEAANQLMDQVASALLETAGAVLSSPGAEQQLSYEGSMEEFGRRLVGVLVQFAELHWSSVASIEKKHIIMQEMLGFSRHPYQQLSSASLGFWGALLREAGISFGAAAKSPIASPREPAAAAGSQGGAAAGGGGGGTSEGGAGRAAPATVMPPECCQLLTEALARQLLRLPVRLDDPGLEVPTWMDSPQEWKDFSAIYRGQIKSLMRGAAKIAPHQVLTSTVAFTQEAISVIQVGGALVDPANPSATSTTLAAAAAGTSALQEQEQKKMHRLHLHMEASVQLLEAVLPAMSDGALLAGDPQLKAGLSGLLQQLMSLRMRDSLLVMMHARGLEAFAKFLPSAPELLVPLITTSFEAMGVVPIEANGQLPPPAKVTPQWKDDAVARMSLAKVLLNVVKEAPGACVPHLQPLVGRIHSLWEQGQLREGEKVAMYEGVMAAAAAGGPELQVQLMEWLLRPLHSVWTQASWLTHLESPQAFAQEYLAHQVLPGGSVVVDSRNQRWSLHHALQLFERLLRHTSSTTSSTAAAAGAVAGNGAAMPLHPFSAHLEWALIPISRIINCLHGLTLPSMAAGLAPLAPAFGMDPVERALRVGGEREAAKKSEEDAGTLAGTNISALRFWLRSIREGSYLVIAQAAQHVGPALWHHQGLAAGISPALASHLEVMDNRHLRILLRHGITPLVRYCPPVVRPPWLLPIFGVLMPQMHQVLTEGWARVVATEVGAGSGSSSSGGAQLQQQRQQQQNLSEEMIRETILRELSREYALLLVEVAKGIGGSSSSSGTAAGGGRSSSTGGGSSSQGGVGSSNGGPGVSSLQPTTSGGFGGLPDGNKGVESVLETLWRYDSRAIQALMATAVAGLCWPDAQSGGKLCSVCRAVAHLAETSHPELEALVLPDMLRSAIMSMLQVSTITIQTEVLNVIRQLLVTWLPRSQLIQDLLLQLPHVNPQMLSSFQEQLLALNSEKEQRNLIKQLLAESAGEQARAVLNAVSKVPVMNVPEPKQKVGGQVVPAHEEIRWDWSEAGIAM